MLVGEIGIPRKEFLYQLYLWEINSIVRGYRKRARTTWEATRWQTYLILRAMGAKLRSEQELQIFPWEKEAETEITHEEADEMRELMENINNGTFEPPIEHVWD